MNNIVVFSAHPDDEVLGAGGTLLKHLNEGDNIYWIIITDISVKQGYSSTKVEQRKSEIFNVSKKFGFKNIFFLKYPTMSLSGKDLYTMIPKISKIFHEIKPETIYCVNRSDAHSDHRITFDAVMACTKSFRHPYLKKVLLYECISETEFAPSLPEKVFIPNYFVNISNFMNSKIEIMKIYASELDKHPFPRSIKNIKALATFRGAMAGVNYAEAFQLIKYIEK